MAKGVSPSTETTPPIFLPFPHSQPPGPEDLRHSVIFTLTPVELEQCRVQFSLPLLAQRLVAAFGSVEHLQDEKQIA